MEVKPIGEGAPFEIKNYTEISVLENLDTTMINLGTCTCQKCRADVMAIALNSLAPKYVVSERGELFTKTGSLLHQNSADVISAITQAVGVVSKKPRH